MVEAVGMLDLLAGALSREYHQDLKDENRQRAAAGVGTMVMLLQKRLAETYYATHAAWMAHAERPAA